MALVNVERDTETLIDHKLQNLGWIDHPNHSNRNVFKQKVKTEKQHRVLEGKRPDYVLYRSQSNIPLAIIEAKKQGANIHKAMEQGVDYAKKLDAPLVFASDGVFTKTLHLKAGQPLLLNGEEVDDFITEKLAIQYLNTHSINTLNKKVVRSRSELISIFSKVNDLLREEGLQQGLERFNEFANLLFLKVLSELEAIKEETGHQSSVDRAHRWEAFHKKEGIELLSYINDTVLKQFNMKYQDEQLFHSLKIQHASNLKEIIDLLDSLQLSDINADVKGDAFEYFIRAYSASNPSDLGEIFTPRHIVKTMVKLLNPKFGESIYDPFCGTGGMLITAFKHVMDGMAHTAENLNRLRQEALYGNELTKTASIAKMNMILAGDGHNNISQKDSYRNPVNAKYDVVITNFPFSQQTRYGDTYMVKNRSGDIISPQHCLRALKPGGRMAFIAPEGLLFKKTKAHKQVRQYLLEHANLESVISLPVGAFQPYNGAKADILFFTECHQVKTKSSFWYFDVKNIGYTLNAQPQKIVGPNDLELVLSEKDLAHKAESYFADGKIKRVDLEYLKKNSYIYLPQETQAIQISPKKGWRSVRLEEICKFEYGYTAKSSTTGNTRYIRITDIQDDGTLGPDKVFVECTEKSKKFLLKQGDVLVARIGSVGKSVLFHENETSIFASYLIRLHFDQNRLLPHYLKHFMQSRNYWGQVQALTSGTVQPQLNVPALKQIQIPLPPLLEQQKIVEELERFQQIRNGAKQVIDHYRPSFEVKRYWPLVRLEEVCIVNPKKPPLDREKEVSFIDMATMPTMGYKFKHHQTNKIYEVEKKGYRYFQENDVLLAKITPCFENGKCGIAENLKNGIGFGSTEFIILRADGQILPEYLYLSIADNKIREIGKKYMTGTAGQKRIPLDFVKKYQIPLPPLVEQQKIVEELETEWQIIEANKHLIQQIEAKMQTKLDNLWED